MPDEHDASHQLGLVIAIVPDDPAHNHAVVRRRIAKHIRHRYERLLAPAIRTPESFTSADFHPGGIQVILAQAAIDRFAGVGLSARQTPHAMLRQP